MQNYHYGSIFITISGEDFDSTAEESSKFPTGDFLGGFLARFWRPNQLSGQTLQKSKGLSENPDKFGEIWWPLSHYEHDVVVEGISTKRGSHQVWSES